jgi:hypothetical protein
MTSLKFNGDISLEEVYSQNREIICDSLLKSIFEVYTDNSIKEIDVVKISINEVEYLITLGRTKFVSALEQAISFYENREEYEKCQECLNIITELKKK